MHNAWRDLDRKLVADLEALFKDKLERDDSYSAVARAIIVAMSNCGIRRACLGEAYDELDI